MMNAPSQTTFGRAPDPDLPKALGALLPEMMDPSATLALTVKALMEILPEETVRRAYSILLGMTPAPEWEELIAIIEEHLGQLTTPSAPL